MKTTSINQRKHKDGQCNDGMIILMIEASYFIMNTMVQWIIEHIIIVKAIDKASILIKV